MTIVRLLCGTTCETLDRLLRMAKTLHNRPLTRRREERAMMEGFRVQWLNGIIACKLL